MKPNKQRLFGSILFIAGALLSDSGAAPALSADDAAALFIERIRPVLMDNCAARHNPADAKNRHDFESDDVADVETRRTLWRDVATQLHNRTMPPGDAKLSESDRLMVADWIMKRLEDDHVLLKNRRVRRLRRAAAAQSP